MSNNGSFEFYIRYSLLWMSQQKWYLYKVYFSLSRWEALSSLTFLNSLLNSDSINRKKSQYINHLPSFHNDVSTRLNQYTRNDNTMYVSVWNNLNILNFCETNVQQRLITNYTNYMKLLNICIKWIYRTLILY